MAKAAAALTFTRESLAETLAQVEEFVRMYGSLASVADRIVELEAEKQERDDLIATLKRERDELRAEKDQLRAESTDGVSPDNFVRFLRQRVHCFGDLNRLRSLLIECQREARQETDGKKTESAKVEVDTDGKQTDVSPGVLMMTLQELTPASTPALAPLFSTSSPPPSPTVATATTPFPVATFSSATTRPASNTKVESDNMLAGEQNSCIEKAGDEEQHEALKQQPSEDVKQRDEVEKETSDSDREKSSARAPPLTRRRRGSAWTKRKRGAAIKRLPTPTTTRTTPARRGRPPSRKRLAEEEEKKKKEAVEEQPAKRMRKSQDVKPRQIFQWPQIQESSSGQSGSHPGKQSTGGDTPHFQVLDFRVVASLEQSKPWDSMYSLRTRWLRIPDLTSAPVVEWTTWCLKAQYTRRQAYWERLHWLPDSCCTGMQWEKYKVARQERAALADREWKSLYAESVRLMTESLLPEDVWCDPALWPLPEKPVLLLPKSVDLYAQIRLADSTDPIRLYFVNAPAHHPFFTESLEATYPTKHHAPLVGGEKPDAAPASENKWRPVKRGKRGPKTSTTKENCGLVKANAAADVESEPEVE